MEFRHQTSLLHLLHRASQVATDRVSRGLGDNELTVRQVVILSAIAAQEGCSQTDLVASTGVDRSTLADVVKRLLKRGLISRRRAKHDARAYAVRLTAEGQKTLDEAIPVLASIEIELLETLPTKKRSELVWMLGELAAKGDA